LTFFNFNASEQIIFGRINTFLFKQRLIAMQSFLKKKYILYTNEFGPKRKEFE